MAKGIGAAFGWLWNKIRSLSGREIIFLILLVLAVTLAIRPGCAPEGLRRIYQKVRVLDTLLVEGPTHYIDRWHETIVYRESDPDTILYTEYIQAPVTVDLVRAMLINHSTLQVEIMVNDSISVLLGGEVAPYGDTEIIVNPDSTISFVEKRFGLSPHLTIGISSRPAAVASLETFYVNRFLFFDALHFPNLLLEYKWTDRTWWGGLAISADVSPFNTPLRLGIGYGAPFGQGGFLWDQRAWTAIATLNLLKIF